MPTAIERLLAGDTLDATQAKQLQDRELPALRALLSATLPADEVDAMVTRVEALLAAALAEPRPT